MVDRAARRGAGHGRPPRARHRATPARRSRSPARPVRTAPPTRSCSSTTRPVQRFNAAYRGPLPGQDRAEPVRRLGSRSGCSTTSGWRWPTRCPTCSCCSARSCRRSRAAAKLLDFAPTLAADPAWKRSSTRLVRRADRQAGPRLRDPAGARLDRHLLQQGAVREGRDQPLPGDLERAARRLRRFKAAGITCFAMDGNWVTLLMWANLIGTQKGGGGLPARRARRRGGYAGNPAVVRATEFLRALHTDGYVNAGRLHRRLQQRGDAVRPGPGGDDRQRAVDGAVRHQGQERRGRPVRARRLRAVARLVGDRPRPDRRRRQRRLGRAAPATRPSRPPWWRS